MTDDLTSLETTERRIITCEQEIQSYLSEIGDFGWDELGYLAVALRNLADSVRDALKTTRKLMATAMPAREVEVPGVGRFTRRKDERIQWNYEDALERVVARCADDWTDDMPPAAFASLVAHEVMAVAGLSYLRKTALRARRIDPDEFLSSEDFGLDVQLPAKPKPRDFGEDAA